MFGQIGCSLLVGAVVALTPSAEAGVEISEFMAKNDTTLATSAREYEDWIEILNDSGAALDLAEWSYHDQGVDLATAWRVLDHPELTLGSGWSRGSAPLGYESSEATTVGYGGNANNKHITTYFVKSFTVPNASTVDSLLLELRRDDGAVVWINGVEAKRDNMVAVGTVNYSTLALETVSNEDETTFFAYTLTPADLVDGNNVMAVEIHQRAIDSSDLSFALRLKGTDVLAADLQDGDADGMGDTFELLHFGSTEAGLPEVDSDGDGVSNFDEYLAGTFPVDTTSFFKIDQIDGNVITWAAVPGRKYTVYWSLDLQTPFVPIAVDLVVGSYADTLHAGDSTGFYRIGVELE